MSSLKINLKNLLKYSFIFAAAVCLTIAVAWEFKLGFNSPDQPPLPEGSCNNTERPTDQALSASLINVNEGINMINSFGVRMYSREAYRDAIPEASITTTSSRILASADPDPNHRVGAFISKYMLDEIFTADLTANGVMCFIGNDATGQLQFFIMPSVKRSGTAPPTMPVGTPLMFQLAPSGWCPTNCDVR